MKSLNDRRDSAHALRDNLIFMDFISKLNLIELKLKDHDFIWSNRREHPSMACLDQFLLSDV